MIMESEILSIKLGLVGTYWDTSPEYRIKFNDQLISEGLINAPSGQVQFIECRVDNNQPQGVLTVELLNKNPDRDTVKSNYDSADYTIVKDMMLDVDSLLVDDIDLGNLIYTASEYRPNYPDNYQSENKPEVITGTKTMGWNGVWSMTWGNPFYIWLLESL